MRVQGCPFCKLAQAFPFAHVCQLFLAWNRLCVHLIERFNVHLQHPNLPLKLAGGKQEAFMVLCCLRASFKGSKPSQQVAQSRPKLLAQAVLQAWIMTYLYSKIFDKYCGLCWNQRASAETRDPLQCHLWQLPLQPPCCPRTAGFTCWQPAHADGLIHFHAASRPCWTNA
jgi:hypothetical protein